MRRILTIILSILAVCLCLDVAYGWMSNKDILNLDINAITTASYYKGGDGSEDNPFLISNARHLYNLSWLQNLGMYDEKSYYFSLANDIDMTGFEIPPIGINGYGITTNSHPFIGVFNGNGYTIRNCIITTNPKIAPGILDNRNFDYGDYLGFFGIIDTKDNDSESFIGCAYAFYLQNISVLTSFKPMAVGLIAGYVNGDISQIGVEYSNIMVDNFQGNDTSISKYTLLGDYHSDVMWEGIPNSGYSYGTTLDVLEFRMRMEKILANSTAPKLPKVDDGDGLTPSSNNYMPISIDSSLSSYEGEDATEVTSKINTGYYVGNSVKAYRIKMPSNTSFYESTMASGIYNDVTDRVSDKIKESTIGNDNLYAIRLQEKIDVNNNLVTIEDGRCADYVGKIILPRRCIWFSPQQSGTMKFVIYSQESSNFSLYKVTREKPGDYTSRLTGYEWYDGNSPRQTSLEGGRLYYYEYEVTEDDINNKVEYALGNDRASNGAYFCYLDLGMGSFDMPYEKYIKDIDFVYKIDSGFSDLSLNSNIYFSLDLSDIAGSIYFRRNEGEILYFNVNIQANAYGDGKYNMAEDRECYK